MLTEAKIVDRAPQPYAAVELTVSQPEISQKAPQLTDEVIGWIKGQGGQPAGAPFFNYVSFFPGGTMKMQVGMPTDAVLRADGRFVTGELPGGRYASLTATAPYAALHDANMKLDAWVREQGLDFAGTMEGEAMVDATRLEIYHKDPGEDPSGHPVTEIAFRLK